MRRARRLAAAALLAVAALLALGQLALAASPIRAPLVGEVVVETPAGAERVAIDATLRVAATVGDEGTTIRTSVQRASAVGVTSGERYRFTGADTIVIPGPPEPTAVTAAEYGLILGLIAVPVQVQLTLTFDPGGNLIHVSPAFFLSIE